MRKILAMVAMSVGLVTVPPLGERALLAGGITRRAVVSCPSGPAECWPTSFAFTPGGGSIFYVERYTGEIRRFRTATGNDSRWGRIGNLSTAGEQGLLGLAIDPRWERGPRFQWVYVYFTQQNPLVNVIQRLRRREEGGTRRERLTRIPAASGYHNGGVIRFGPDGFLYAVTGEAHQPSRAQDPQDLGGKVLRMKVNGGRPRGNPFPGSLAWSRGHRNSFGFAFDRRTGRLFQSENGPSCDDELNDIRKGRNYGWGAASECPRTSESGPNPVQPEKRFNPPIAITGVDFCRGCDLGMAIAGDILFGAFNDGKIRHANMRNNRRDIGRVGVLFDNGRGILSVKAGPGGSIYFSDKRSIYVLER